MKKIRALAALLAAVCLLAGCARAQQPFALAPAEEQKLILYTSHKEEVYAPILKEFEEETGIWVETVTGGTSELLDRIAAEATAGTPTADVMFGGGVESLAAYEDYFASYPCAQTTVLKKGTRPTSDRWVPFSSLPVVIIYNTKLVQAGAVTGWADLLDPCWYGRIAMADPTVSGSGYTALRTLSECLGQGEGRWEILSRFEANLGGEPLLDSGQVVPAVAQGTARLGVTLEETALKGIAKGADIAIVYPKEGTSALPDGCALIDGAPHRKNAERFLDFVQSYPVQQLLVDELYRRTVRADVREPEGLPSENRLHLIAYDLTNAQEVRQEFMQRWGAICRENHS